MLPDVDACRGQLRLWRRKNGRSAAESRDSKLTIILLTAWTETLRPAAPTHQIISRRQYYATKVATQSDSGSALCWNQCQSPATPSVTD